MKSPQEVLQEYLDGIEQIEKAYENIQGKHKSKERSKNAKDAKKVKRQKMLFKLAIKYLDHESPVNPITIFNKSIE